jgi:hypothetical protein
MKSEGNLLISITLAVIVKSFVARIADSHKLKQKFLPDMLVSEMVRLRRGRVQTTLATVLIALENERAFPLPLWCLEIGVVTGEPLCTNLSISIVTKCSIRCGPFLEVTVLEVIIPRRNIREFFGSELASFAAVPNGTTARNTLLTNHYSSVRGGLFAKFDLLVLAVCLLVFRVERVVIDAEARQLHTSNQTKPSPRWRRRGLQRSRTVS